jgi:antitoxin component YwqK of YwqJK toxin-antitoxin module
LACPPVARSLASIDLEIRRVTKQKIQKRIFLILVFLAGAGLSTLAGAQVVARFFYDEKGNVTRQERDTNGDGKMDRWLFYGSEGQIERKEQDSNGDGKADVRVSYENNEPVRSEEDRNFDGRSDRVTYFQGGKVGRVEEDTKGNGKMDSFSYF